MWGSSRKPTAHHQRISWIARVTDIWANPMATKAASQLHMCGKGGVRR